MKNNFYTEFIEFLSSQTIEKKHFSEHSNFLEINFPDRIIILIPLGSYPIFKHPNPTKNTLYIWEDLWLNKKEIIKNRITSLFHNNKRIFARKTEVRKITKEEATDFLSKNHLNFPLSGKFRYALFQEDIMVACIVFSRVRIYPRENAEALRSYEIIRHANLAGHTVTGGLSKLIKHFVREKTVKHLMTYVDKEWSQGDSYKKMGFTLTKQRKAIDILLTKPSYIREYPKAPITPFAKEKDQIIIQNLGSLKYELCLS